MARLSIHNLNIKSKITLIVMGVSCVSTLLIVLIFLLSEYDSSHSNLVNRMTIQSKILSHNIAPIVLFKDGEAAQEMLSAFTIDPAIREIQVYDLNGEIMFEREAPRRSDKTPWFSEFYFQITEYVSYDKKSIALIVVIASDHEVYTRVFLVLRNSVFIFCFVMIFSWLLSFLFQGAISSPILALHNLSQKVALTGNYSLRADVKNTDEVGRLSAVFNQMLEHVEHRDTMLEKQVSQRTMELEKLAEEFKYRAFHDVLTGLPNRALMNERFELCVEHANRHKNKFACLLLDLDNFKTINDTKGHEFGDDLLRQVAKRLKVVVRSEDLVSRLGGDEFIILLSDIDDERAAYVVANKILHSLSQEILIKNEVVNTAASIGGALYPDHGENLVTVKRNADVAMYRAKDRGKNQFCLFSPDMQEEVKYRLMIQNDLRAGLNSDQILVYFQPKVLPRENRVSGCETLVRWLHPKEGLMLPNKFIPYAEEVGLVQQVDYYVIEQACRSLSQWKTSLPEQLSLAINLSGWHFRSFAIVDKLREHIENYRVNPALLEIEITEAVLIQDPEMAQKVVRAIKDLGVFISLDDFGMGYSSLDYLRTLPIDCIKIDRSFVQNIHANRQDQRITKGIISLARGLDLVIVAEGVEIFEHESVLLNLGCECMQGYYYLKPAPETEFLAWTNTFNQNAAKVSAKQKGH